MATIAAAEDKMKLNKVIIKNLKSYYPQEEVVFNDHLNLFVGPNAGGKSNLFELIQGSLSSLIYKHDSVSLNRDRTNQNTADYGRSYKIQFDSSDGNLMRDLFEKHHLHQQEMSQLELFFDIKKEDIQILKDISKFKEKIIKFLEKEFAGASPIIDSLRNFSFDASFNNLVNTTSRVLITNQSISGYYSEKPELSIINQKFFDILQYFNVLYEISTLAPDIKIAPNFKYIGPHRSINQPPKEIHIDLTQHNLDKNFVKGLNQSKDVYMNIIDSCYQQIARLYDENKENKLLKVHKRLLERYLSMSYEITDKKIRYRHEYRLRFFRLNDTPIKLSSGEKEFFSLISAIILSELKDGLVLLDEPELHQHSQWQKVMVNLIEELSEDYNLQFLIISHSPYIVTPSIISSTYRIYKYEDNSSVTKPDKNSLSISPAKDLLHIINSSNNEKIFFADKVILVEGMSDQLVFTKSLRLIKESIGNDKVIEVLPVGSKNNLLKFRRFLDAWKIKNYLIADLDFLKELVSNRDLLETESIKDDLATLSSEISSLYSLSSSKLKDVLTRSYDGLSVLELIKKKRIFSNRKFNLLFNNLTEKIVASRAISLNKKLKLSNEIKELLFSLQSEEKIYILEKGCLEKYFTADGSTGDKVALANKIVANMTSRNDIKRRIRQILNLIIED